MLHNGEDLIAEIPLEHLVMYEGYSRVGILIELKPVCLCCKKGVAHFLSIKHGRGSPRFALYTEDYVELTVDHIVARHNGGKNHISNYQVLCLFCNRVKGSGDMSIEELRDRVKNITKNLL